MSRVSGDWAALVRQCEREAVKRAYGHLWAGAAQDALKLGRPEAAYGYRRLARRAFKRAARIRRAVLSNTQAGRV